MLSSNKDNSTSTPGAEIHWINGRLLLAIKSLCSCSEVCVRVDGVDFNRLLWMFDFDNGCHLSCL